MRLLTSGQYDQASVVYHATSEQRKTRELTLKTLPARTIPVICGYKVNLRCPCALHEAVTGNASRATLNFSTRWRRVVSLSSRPLYPKVNGSHYPLPTRLGRPESRSGQFGDSKSPLPCWESNHDFSVVQPAANVSVVSPLFLHRCDEVYIL
jgi:hypothetical protein